MLAVVISLLFGIAALAAVVVIHASIAHGIRRGRQIVAELAAGEAVPAIPVPRYREPALPPLFAAA